MNVPEATTPQPAAPDQPLSAGDKLRMMGILVIVFGVCMGPLWCRRWGLIRLDDSAGTLVNACRSILEILLPLALARWLPRLAGFDLTWLPRKRSHTLWFLALVAAFLLVRVWIAWMEGGWQNPARPRQYTERMPWAVIVYACTALALAPIGEEILYRGYLLGQCEKIMPGRVALFVQAAIFSLDHLVGFGRSVGIFLMGLAFGVWRQRARSFLPIIAFHIIFNLVMVGPIIPAMYRWAREVNASPVGGRILSLKKEAPATAIPAVLSLLADSKGNVHYYAEWTLSDKWIEAGRAGDGHFAKALESPDPAVLDGVLSIIWMVGPPAQGLTLNVRDVTMKSDNPLVQWRGVLALERLHDLEGLHRVSLQHPSARARQYAERSIFLLERGKGGKNSPAPPRPDVEGPPAPPGRGKTPPHS